MIQISNGRDTRYPIATCSIALESIIVFLLELLLINEQSALLEV
jgi:hypothetical protein